MAVEAALDRRPDAGLPRLRYDPLTAAVLSLAEIRKMTAEMLEKNRAYLPQFKTLKI